MAVYLMHRTQNRVKEMKKHNNNIKKKDKSQKTNLNEMEVSDLSEEREFKITKILSKVRTVVYYQNEISKKKNV